MISIRTRAEVALVKLLKAECSAIDFLEGSNREAECQDIYCTVLATRAEAEIPGGPLWNVFVDVLLVGDINTLETVKRRQLWDAVVGWFNRPDVPIKNAELKLEIDGYVVLTDEEASEGQATGDLLQVRLAVTDLS